MSKPLTCLRCGFVGWDVRMRGITVPAEEAPIVDVPLRVNERHGSTNPPELAYLKVPGIFGREPRCDDTAACDARVASIAAEAG